MKEDFASPAPARRLMPVAAAAGKHERWRMSMVESLARWVVSRGGVGPKATRAMALGVSWNPLIHPNSFHDPALVIQFHLQPNQPPNRPTDQQTTGLHCLDGRLASSLLMSRTPVRNKRLFSLPRGSSADCSATQAAGAGGRAPAIFHSSASPIYLNPQPQSAHAGQFLIPSSPWWIELLILCLVL
jgi:hypothetical protein